MNIIFSFLKGLAYTPFLFFLSSLWDLYKLVLESDHINNILGIFLKIEVTAVVLTCPVTWKLLWNIYSKFRKRPSLKVSEKLSILEKCSKYKISILIQLFAIGICYIFIKQEIWACHGSDMGDIHHCHEFSVDTLFHKH